MKINRHVSVCKPEDVPLVERTTPFCEIILEGHPLHGYPVSQLNIFGKLDEKFLEDIFICRITNDCVINRYEN